MVTVRWKVACVVALSVFAACGDERPSNPFVDSGDPIDGTDGDTDGPTVDAPPPVDGPVDTEGPTLTVVSHAVPADFSASEIIVEDRFSVTCRAEPNGVSGEAVDPQSVEISALGAGAEVTVFAQPSTVADEYTGDVVVSGFPNGPIVIRCTASDTGSPARTNSADVATFLDLGPTIDVFTPAADAAYANQLNLLFQVTANPVDSADDGADPDASSVEVEIAGVTLDNPGDFTENPVGSGRFEGSILFDDARFNPSLEDLNTVTIRAANTRTGGAVTREDFTVFDADSDGPTILVDSPEAGALVSGIFSLTVTVTDDAGVDDLSVIATIAGTSEFELSPIGANQYQGSFDTRGLSQGLVYPTVIVRARDSVGNQSAVGVVLVLDNVAPIASLDPPLIREAEYDEQDARLECSRLFDPLGEGVFVPDFAGIEQGGAANDGQTIPQLSQLRARVEDRSNGAFSTPGIIIPSAGVDSAGVQLYILDESSNALLVDTDGDTICDEINPLLVPTSVPQAANEAAVIDLSGIEATGTADFRPVPDVGSDDPNDPYDEPFATTGDVQCASSDASDPPNPVCIQTEGPRIIKTEVGADPVIWTIAPTTDLQCWGNGWDSLATNISDGWACVAVRAVDNLGNVGISAPLRVCIDHDGDGAEGCILNGSLPSYVWGSIAAEGARPDCTGTYNALTNTVDSGTPCVMRDPNFDTVPFSNSLLYEDYPALQLRRKDL